MKDRIIDNLEDSTPVDAFGNKADIIPDNGPVVLRPGPFDPTPKYDIKKLGLSDDCIEERVARRKRILQKVLGVEVSDTRTSSNAIKGFSHDFDGETTFDAFRACAEETRNKDFDGEVLNEMFEEKYGKKSGFYRGSPNRTLGKCEITSWRVFERATIVNSKGKKGIKKRRTARVVTRTKKRLHASTLL